MSLRPDSGSVPDQPGSYQFKDQAGRIIYVGKAKSLRNRLNSYFQDKRNLHSRTVQMLAAAESVEWIEVPTEVDALMLEYSLIQRHQPRFNVRLRDDKSYPFLAITMKDEWPRAMVMRGKRKRGNRYFGPFGHAYAIRETLDLLLRTFPIRTCSDNKMTEHQRLGRPCLLFHIEQCAGPCVGEITGDDYRDLVGDLTRFLEGDTEEVLRDLNNKMGAASSSMEFELAARYRDRLSSVKKAIEKRQIAGTRNEDFDVIGVHDDELEASVQVFFVRKGRVMGQRGSIVDKVEDFTQPDLIARIIEDVYHDENPIGMPKNVFVPSLPEKAELYEEWLTGQRGSRVEIRVPQRGDKRALHETATKNARESFARHRLKRGTDHNSRSKALEELQRHLALPNAPLRIECYDMSHLQGTAYVGSMVVLEDALPRKSEYRRFKIRDVEGNDDFAAMEEVLSRRFRNYLDERDLPSSEITKFSYPPQLLVVDGGKGQLGVAVRVLESMGLEEEIPVVALAKQFEEVFIPGRSQPIELPRGSEALYLLQRIRDESHRFAIAYHRKLRDKRMTRSVLDEIPGLGDMRKKRLIKEFGGVRKVQQASLSDLLALTWLPNKVAAAVHERTQGQA
ncbi:MAG: excinuclease ABC subunit C [marine actinobacterium MedAcidi-G3]|nr:MAG: excinuclease ABC subunit C [marine actinobacterium MedAcidi-G3]MAR53399.1 excinuclease ABC subunit UvrC [Acidimicrobiaceae bacterium]MBA4812107.1 excinuclease ABC subunit UvrC [Acidimicrobiales bacterium]OUW86747.1 MAG: excinuclease ABC subunit C [Acidimicrobiaceae bacterium TMED224]|tara:strand:+ start:47700 stop:49559 length:1860 start_codon:yes stop_codon:yes gene_type:complete